MHWHKHCLTKKQQSAVIDKVKGYEMKNRRKNILCHHDINSALNRYITRRLFESRIMEHPQKALDRTSFDSDASIPIDWELIQTIKK